MAFLDSLRIRGTHICQRLTHRMCCQIDHSCCLPVVRASLWCTSLPSVFAHGSEHRKDSELVNGDDCQKTAEEDDQKPDHLQCLHGAPNVSRGVAGRFARWEFPRDESFGNVGESRLPSLTLCGHPCLWSLRLWWMLTTIRTQCSVVHSSACPPRTGA
jgi:hypothetical protein